MRSNSPRQQFYLYPLSRIYVAEAKANKCVTHSPYHIAKDLEVRISSYTSISSVLDHFPRCCQEKAIDRQKEAFHSF
jgi:hypothetical protein